MPRKSTGKRLRFQVFERDHFTCQYCGAQPPAVVLVTDHVLAVAHGGESTIENLVTSCEPCNQGKADRVLGAVAPRPDADLLYLAAQQEIAEIRRFQETAIERDRALAELVEWFQELWSTCGNLDWAPHETVIRSLIRQHGYEVTQVAIEDVAHKVGTGYVDRAGARWVGYLYAVARTTSAERGDVA